MNKFLKSDFCPIYFPSVLCFTSERMLPIITLSMFVQRFKSQWKKWLFQPQCNARNWYKILTQTLRICRAFDHSPGEAWSSRRAHHDLILSLIFIYSWNDFRPTVNWFTRNHSLKSWNQRLMNYERLTNSWEKLMNK